jgi:hypothetical protein
MSADGAAPRHTPRRGRPYDICHSPKGILSRIDISRFRVLTVAGKTATEALYQPHPVGELYLPGRARCARQCDAKYLSLSIRLTRSNRLYRQIF